MRVGLGLESKDINVLQTGLRAAIVYLVTVLIVRLAKKRFMGQATAFDVILGIMIGSIVSRAVTGNAPLLPTLAATAVLLGMHWLFSGIAMRWHGFFATEPFDLLAARARCRALATVLIPQLGL